MQHDYVVQLYPGRPKEGQKPERVFTLRAYSELDAVETVKQLLLPSESHLTYLRADRST